MKAVSNSESVRVTASDDVFPTLSVDLYGCSLGRPSTRGVQRGVTCRLLCDRPPVSRLCCLARHGAPCLPVLVPARSPRPAAPVATYFWRRVAEWRGEAPGGGGPGGGLQVNTRQQARRKDLDPDVLVMDRARVAVVCSAGAVWLG